MKKILENSLKNLIGNLDYEVYNGNIENITINKLCFDTRKVERDDIFVCLKGANFDAHSKISDVSDKGAKVIVVEKGNEYLKDALINDGTVVIAVLDTRVALAIISDNYFLNPSKSMKIIGITGTKGKTTTAFMTKKVLETAGYKVGMIGTVGIFYGDKHIETENTTPESYYLHENFLKMKEEGCEYVVMEVSSQSLKYNRVYGIHFLYALWTNIAPEHIGKDEHEDYNDYLNSKLKIFDQCEDAVINTKTNNLNEIADRCKKNRNGFIVARENVDVKLTMPGKYNVENANLVYSFANALGLSERDILKGLAGTIVPGRCEVVYKSNDIEVIVDFAHEKNGAEAFLKTIKEYIGDSKKRLVVIFGCGGNRAKDRRYGMGEVVGRLADFVVLTADNSRMEKTIDIIADIETTLGKYKTKDDTLKGYVIKEIRKDAIEYAIKNHKPNDVVCVIGKGHETSNDANGVKTHFSDREAILEIVNG